MHPSIRIAFACAVIAFSGALAAQTYPAKPVNVVVPFPAGGPTDTVARTVAMAMQTRLNQTFIVENVGGASGTIGSARVARAAPDGYSLLLNGLAFATSPALYPKLTFDPIGDFEPIGEIADVPMTLIARSNFAPKDVPELLTLLKAQGGSVSIGNAGVGSASHLCSLLFMRATGTTLVTVPFKGAGPALRDLLGGQIDMLCDQTTTTTPHITGGKVKAYGVTAMARVPTLPELRTLDEQGVKGFSVIAWHGLFAPKGTSKELVDVLSRALQEALQDQQVQARLSQLGAVVVPRQRATPEAMRNLLRAEVDKWAPIIRQAGITAE